MANRILNCTDRRALDLAGLHRRGARGAASSTTTSTLFEMGAHPFLTLTLFIAMFERDHGPLEYQIAYGAGDGAPHAALPRHRHLSRARRRAHTPTASRPTCAEHPDPAPAAGRAAGPRSPPRRVVPLDLLCAIGTSYFGRAGAALRARACRASAWSSSPPALAAGTRVWFATSAGMAPGDGSLAERCAVPDVDRGRRSTPTGRRTPLVAALGLSAVAAWMALTWRAAAAAGRAGARPGRRRRRRPGRRSARRASLGAGRVVAACRSRTTAERARAAGADAVVACAADDGRARRSAARGLGGAARRRGRPGLRRGRDGGVAGRSPTAAGWSTSAVPPATRRSFSSAVLRSRSASVLGYTNNALTPTSAATP